MMRSVQSFSRVWVSWAILTMGHVLGLAHASELSERLQTNHHVLLMRHALAPGVGDPPGYRLDRCDTQRNLDQTGRAQAQRIGNWLRAQGIQRAQVMSSIWCRCVHTAERLGYGEVSIHPALASFFDEPQQAGARLKDLQGLIAQSLPTKGDQALILVTHHVNIEAFMGQAIGSGDMVLAQVTPQGRLIQFKLYPSP